jgi:hypothetical protein
MDKAKIALHPRVNPPEVWATFLAVKQAERNRLAQTLQIDGSPERVKEFLHTLGVREEKSQPVRHAAEQVVNISY